MPGANGLFTIPGAFYLQPPFVVRSSSMTVTYRTEILKRLLVHRSHLFVCRPRIVLFRVQFFNNQQANNTGLPPGVKMVDLCSHSRGRIQWEAPCCTELVFTWEFIISVFSGLDSIAEYEFQYVDGEV